MIYCVLCAEAHAVVGIDLPEGGEYYPACADCAERLGAEGFVSVALRTEYVCLGCGDSVSVGESCWDY